jgi:hypothetical protein
MRAMLDNLLDDLKKVLLMPEWPAAEALMAAASERLDWILAGKKADKGAVSVHYKSMALELLGSFIGLVASEVRLAALPLAVDCEEEEEEEAAERGALGAPAAAEEVVGAVVDRYFQGRGMLAGSVVAASLSSSRSEHSARRSAAAPAPAATREDTEVRDTEVRYTLRFADGQRQEECVCDWKELRTLVRVKPKRTSTATAKGRPEPRASRASPTGSTAVASNLEPNKVRANSRSSRSAQQLGSQGAQSSRQLASLQELSPREFARQQRHERSVLRELV